MDVLIYPGTFDPMTKGHLDIITRAAGLCQELYVCIMHNQTKANIFTPEERVEMARRCIADLGLTNVKVESYPGLLVDYMKARGTTVVVRGLRSEFDLRYEQEMATANRLLYDQFEVIFLASRPENSYTSSTIVREVGGLGGNISGMVPQVIEAEVQTRLKEAADAKR